MRTSGRSLSVFDTAGVYLGSHAASEGPFMTLPWAAATDEAGMLYERRPLAPAIDDTPTYGLVRSTLRPDSGLQPVDTFPLRRYEERLLVSTQGSVRMRTPVPFSGAQVERVDRRGEVWIARTEEYRLVRVDFAGDTLQIVERAFVPRDVSAAERDSVRRTTGLRGSQLPEAKPALRGFLLDRKDGGVWVHLDHDDEGVERWDLFDAGGRFLGPVEAGHSLQPGTVPVLRSGSLYAVVRDELGVPYVVRLGLREGQ